MNKPKLSIIILNYNTRELLSNCLNSVKAYMNEVPSEVIVSDNCSTDESSEMVRKDFPWVKLVEGPNDGYSKGNNRAKNLVNGEMVLFLNPDTEIKKDVFLKTVGYLEKHIDVGALTCKLLLQNGKLDKDVRRRFPTPSISFNHLILKKDSKYYYEDISEDVTHEVDSIQGAFFLTRKKILDKVGWFDEKYFFDGEDIDLCFQIKKLGYKIIYYPETHIIHLKGVTKGKVKKWSYKVDSKQRMKIRLAGVNSMERFYRKNLWDNYPLIFSYFVIFGIKIFKVIRFIKMKFLT